MTIEKSELESFTVTLAQAGALYKVYRRHENDLKENGKTLESLSFDDWMRRNGKTQKWVKDANRIRVPFKMGLKGYGAITETDFDADGKMKDYYRYQE